MVFCLGSPAFREGESIGERHARRGGDLSVPLFWTEPPVTAGAFALVMEDPDAPGGSFTHWLVYNLAATARTLPEGLPRALHLSLGVTAKQGRNDYGHIGYGGPEPPPGKQHRYWFRIFALDRKLPLRAGAEPTAFGLELENHALAVAELSGLFP